MSQAQWELHLEEMALQEAIQLSLAMEESRRELEAASAAYAGAVVGLSSNESCAMTCIDCLWCSSDLNNAMKRPASQATVCACLGVRPAACCSFLAHEPCIFNGTVGRGSPADLVRSPALICWCCLADGSIPPIANAGISAAAAAQAAALEIKDPTQPPAGGDWGGSEQKQQASYDWGAASHQSAAGAAEMPVRGASDWGAPQQQRQRQQRQRQQQHRQQQQQQQQAGGDWETASRQPSMTSDWEAVPQQVSHGALGATAHTQKPNKASAWRGQAAMAHKSPAEPYYESHDPVSHPAWRGSGGSRSKEDGIAGEDSSGSYESAASHVDAGDWADLQEDTSQCAYILLAVMWHALLTTD